MRLERFDHLVLTTADLDACLRFYVDLLGMELDGTNQRYALRFGDQKINIHRRPAEFLPAAARPAPGSADFCLVAAGDIKEIFAELRAKNAPFELPEITARTGALGPIDSIYLRDPDGNLVEISTYRKD